MGMAINTNMASLTAQRNLTTNQSSLATSMQRLSSGLRVNNAADDAAGLAIASRMDSQVRGINVAIRNANDGISMAQTAEGASATTTDILDRLRASSLKASAKTATPASAGSAFARTLRAISIACSYCPSRRQDRAAFVEARLRTASFPSFLPS